MFTASEIGYYVSKYVIEKLNMFYRGHQNHTCLGVVDRQRSFEFNKDFELCPVLRVQLLWPATIFGVGLP